MTMEGVVRKTDANYPELLQNINDAPAQLYYRGAWDQNLFRRCLAVVGARRMTGYGKRVIERMVQDIAAEGITIISGFMYGVDATSHTAAILAGGRTIAVMPCGIDRVHPEYQKELYASILNHGGLILSEFAGTMLPSNWTYPKRNRIVAGLSQAVLVVEAGLKSGSLITAGYAKKYNRKLFAVPGPITSAASQGANALIQEGAEIANSAKEILKFFGVAPLKEAHVASVRHKGLELRVVQELTQEPLEIDVLARRINIPVASMGTLLSLLELKGVISLEGRTYHIC